MGPGFESLRVYEDKVLKTIEFQNPFIVTECDFATKLKES